MSVACPEAPAIRPALSDEFYSSQQLADRLCVSLATVHRWAREGTFPGAIRVGRLIRWKRPAVEQVLTGKVA